MLSLSLSLALVGPLLAAAPLDLPADVLATAAETKDPEIWKRILFDVSGTTLKKDPHPNRRQDLRLDDAPRRYLGATRSDFLALAERFLDGPCRDDATVRALFAAIALRLEVDLPLAVAAKLGAGGGPKIRGGSVLGLSRGWDSRALAALDDTAEKGDEPWRSHARRATSAFAADREAAAEALLAHPKPNVREEAILLLTRLEAFDSAERIAARLSDEASAVREAAAYAAETLLVVAAEPRLREMARNSAEPIGVREVALVALATFALPESSPAFIEALDERHENLARLGLHGLARLGDPGTAARVAALLERKGGPSAASVIETLGRLGWRDALPRVRPFLESPELSTRQAAIEAASRLTEGAADVPLFLRLLDDLDARVGVEAWRALLRLGRDEAVAPSAWFLERDFADVEAMWHLSLLLHPEAAPRLRDTPLRRSVYEGTLGGVVEALASETGVEIRIESPLLRRGDRRRVPLAPAERRLGPALRALDRENTTAIATADGAVRLLDRAEAKHALLEALARR